MKIECSSKYENASGRDDALYYMRRSGSVIHKCFACNEAFVLEIHTFENSHSSDNDDREAVYLCPTHHKAIHVGYARIDGDAFVWIHEDGTPR
jgi:hypothetical protein